MGELYYFYDMADDDILKELQEAMKCDDKPLPDGKYHVTGFSIGKPDPGVYIEVKNGKQREITKEEYGNNNT